MSAELYGLADKYVERCQQELEEILDRPGIVVIDNSYLGGFSLQRLDDTSLDGLASTYEGLGDIIAIEAAHSDVSFPSEARIELTRHLSKHRQIEALEPSPERARLIASLEQMQIYMGLLPSESYLGNKGKANLGPLNWYMMNVTSRPGVIKSYHVKHGASAPRQEHAQHDGMICAKGLAIALANPDRRVGILTRDSDFKRIKAQLAKDRPRLKSLAEEYGFEYDPTLFSRLSVIYVAPISKMERSAIRTAHHHSYSTS